MDSVRLRSLSPKLKTLVAVAVLLDGFEGAEYLERDSVNGAGLKKAASDLAAQPPELRMPFVGTALRGALKDMR